MNIRKLPTRISGGDDAARNFVKSNPDCPQFLREAAAAGDQAGQPGFGHSDLPHNRCVPRNRCLDLMPFAV